MTTHSWWGRKDCRAVLDRFLREINSARVLPVSDSRRDAHWLTARALLTNAVPELVLPDTGAALEDGVEWLLDRPSTRLAVYGSLAPDESNHWVIHDIDGNWVAGRVRGTVQQAGWGSAMGYPGMTWEPEREATIGVTLLTSEVLPAHWDRLDKFEGNDYHRILVPVEGISGGIVVANIYEIVRSEK